MVKHKNSFVASLLKNSEVELNDDSKVIAVDNDLNNDLTEAKPKQKGTSKNPLNLIQDCVINYQNLEYSKSEKANISINPNISQKLKLVSIASKVSLFDLSNAILHQYLEDNKKEIAILLKKLSM